MTNKKKNGYLVKFDCMPKFIAADLADNSTLAKLQADSAKTAASIDALGVECIVSITPTRR